MRVMATALVQAEKRAQLRHGELEKLMCGCARKKKCGLCMCTVCGARCAWYREGVARYNGVVGERTIKVCDGCDSDAEYCKQVWQKTQRKAMNDRVASKARNAD